MKKVLFALIALAVLASCTGAKEFTYFQNIEDVELESTLAKYSAQLMPKDQLTITVNASDENLATMFNLTVSRATAYGSANISTGSQRSLITYVVDNEGFINYPVLGKIYVAGMTRTELQDYICEQIKPYFGAEEQPIVTVTLTNYRVTVIGEVASPKVVTIGNDRESVLEVIAQAGNLGTYGKRKNVLVIREDVNGEKTFKRLDFTDANIMNDPYYYVQQNDVIYVEPNKQKRLSSDVGTLTTFSLTMLSTLMTLCTFMINIL